ncbi:MAG TPA: efflux RND transporter permease subunit [Polyangia bacterium]
MSAEYFLRRPVLAGVISILITLIGAISIPGLPIAQYPNLALPTVTVNASYVGASAEVVESAVTTPLEQQLNGVEGMREISSSSTNDGRSQITITFEPDRNLDVAAVDVQNRVSTAAPRLPAEVNQAGVTINKAQAQQLMSLGFYAEGDRYTANFLSNYLAVYVVDALKRVSGVGDIRIFGERRFAMRVWLDPTALASRGLVPQDIVQALREQNVQVAAGQVGQPPVRADQSFQLGVRARSRLSEASEFGDIVIQRGPSGSLVKLSDVARVELGAENYQQLLRFNGHPGVGLGIQQLPTANALEVREGVMAELARLSRDFPPGLRFEPVSDNTRAISQSVKEVLITLFEAVALVVLVVFIFLHSGRSLLIVGVTLPVSLIGTFAFVAAFGFSINTLTLFGLTLATGLVVDDAIVVIENTERLIQTEHLSPFEAAKRGMQEVAGAVVATSLVLVAVFVPVAFFPGTTGSIYRQFSLTIAFSILISTVCAITLTPAMCALLLRHKREKAGVFRFFDRALDRTRDAYGRVLERLSRHLLPVVAVFVLLLVATGLLFRSVPTGFIPDEDQGYLIISVQGPEGTSLHYTDKVLKKVEAIVGKLPEATAMFVVGGFSFGGNGPNYATVFVNLKPWDEREGKDQSVAALVTRLRRPLSGIGEARVLPLQPPAIRGVGSVGGFQFVLQDRSGTATLDQLSRVTDDLIAKANQSPVLASVFSSFAASTPQLEVEVDRARAKSLEVPLDQLYGVLQVFLGSQYVNDFDFASRNYRVYVQADSAFRDAPEDIGAFYARSSNGDMLPLEAMVKVRPGTTAQVIRHFNLYRSTEINGVPEGEHSSGEALDAMETVARSTLPESFGFAWTGISDEQQRSGRQTLIIFVLAIAFVFLLLAGLYESFLLPVVILLSVPLAILGGVGLQAARGLANDVFCQVGIVMLVGLASKNAILIVEFAEHLRTQGKTAAEAAIEAARLRLRPILMTSIAFLLGVLPLMLASGAGAGARRSLGTTVFGGMFVSTLVNFGFVPVLYIVIHKLRSRLVRKRPVAHKPVFAEEAPVGGE